MIFQISQCNALVERFLMTVKNGQPRLDVLSLQVVLVVQFGFTNHEVRERKSRGTINLNVEARQ